MKSERLKTQLITNVSHDIKTPLTSIINYVDLLQKDHTPAQEHAYLLVLDRQARKLKKLTEDLVELSKASTGNIPVSLAPTDLNVLLSQVCGEYQQRLEKQVLEPVLSLCEPGAAAMADGRLLWRVLDNLMSNICKYAMPGTRVYLSTEAGEDGVRMVVKNISRYPLNISADERILDSEGKIDPQKLRPITFDPVHNDYLVLGEKVGNAFEAGKKLK